MSDVSHDAAPEPRHAFEDSRRLTGPNRWFAGTGVVLTPLGDRAPTDATGDSGDTLAARDRATREWAERVSRVCAALGWPAPFPRAQRHASGSFLCFAAPVDGLFTATEINEWAWETVAGPGFDLAFGWSLDEAILQFAKRADDELSRPLQRLRAAARQQGLPLFDDDDTVSLGGGAHSLSWPRAALPLPMDVPWPTLRRIPTALVTGSNGKTTCVRLLGAMGRAAGHVDGLCSTVGLSVGGTLQQTGDLSGPAGARAVLETARGGIARRGLAVDQADVALVTNISADHFGEYGVHTVRDIAELKLAVAHAVQGHGLLVLNADDAVLLTTSLRLPHVRTARHAWFAANYDSVLLRDARERGLSTCGTREGQLWLSHSGQESNLGPIARMPLAFGGAATYNVMNLAAAALAAVAGLRLPLPAVAEVLRRFGSQPADNPGRLERWQHAGATVLIDYAHNPDGLTQLLAVAKALPHKRLLLLLGQAGNRDDEALDALARAAAAAKPELVMLKELPTMLRGRPMSQVPQRLRLGLLDAGLATTAIHFGGNEPDAAAALLAQAEHGDVVVMPLHQDGSRERIGRVLRRAP